MYLELQSHGNCTAQCNSRKGQKAGCGYVPCENRFIGGDTAVMALDGLLTELDDHHTTEQATRRYAVEALGKIKLATASQALIKAYERRPEESYPLAALGRTGMAEAVTYLLQRGQHGPPQGDDDLIWGLAMSRDPRAAELLVQWLLTAPYDTARHCRDALDQFMQGEAATPLLAALAQADNDPLRADLLGLLDIEPVHDGPRRHQARDTAVAETQRRADDLGLGLVEGAGLGALLHEVLDLFFGARRLLGRLHTRQLEDEGLLRGHSGCCRSFPPARS